MKFILQPWKLMLISLANWVNRQQQEVIEYRRYVTKWRELLEKPFKKELREWVFGSEDFLRRMLALAEGGNEKIHQSSSRRLKSVSVEEIIRATALEHCTNASQYARFRIRAAGRDMAAWWCRQWTGVPLEELGIAFGVHGTGSVSNLDRRAEQRRMESRKWSNRQHKIETSLGLKTQHKA